jgi:hypothetical protein
MRRTARFRLEQLDVMDDLDALSTLLARVAEETGDRPLSWDPLVHRGWIRQTPPVDPAGFAYAIDPATGRATLSSESPYLPLPVDGPAPAADATEGPAS